MKTITLDDSTWKSLTMMKYAMGVASLDDVINTLLINYEIKKRKEEVKEDSKEVVEPKEEKVNPFTRR